MLQADWGPLPVAAVRIIKDRITKISRGFAFVDFPSVVSCFIFLLDPFLADMSIDC
jgi:hypothetical protein